MQYPESPTSPSPDEQASALLAAWRAIGDDKGHWEEANIKPILERDPEVGLSIIGLLSRSSNAFEQEAAAVHLANLSHEVPKDDYLAVVDELARSHSYAVRRDLIETLVQYPVRHDVSWAEIRESIGPFLRVPDASSSERDR